jgi:hypothetical protein
MVTPKGSISIGRESLNFFSDLCGTVAGMMTPMGSISVDRESLKIFVY